MQNIHNSLKPILPSEDVVVFCGLAYAKEGLSDELLEMMGEVAQVVQSRYQVTEPDWKSIVVDLHKKYVKGAE